MGSADAPDLTAFEDQSDLNDIQDLVKWLVLEEAALLDIKREYEDRKEQMKATKERVAQIFKARGIKSHKLSSGLFPCRMTATKFYVNSDTEQEQLCQWFEDNGLGSSVKRSVNFQTMNSILNTRKEAGESLPNGLVDFTERDSLTMNGKTKFLGENKVNIKVPEISVHNGKVEIK